MKSISFSSAPKELQIILLTEILCSCRRTLEYLLSAYYTKNCALGRAHRRYPVNPKYKRGYYISNYILNWFEKSRSGSGPFQEKKTTNKTYWVFTKLLALQIWLKSSFSQCSNYIRHCYVWVDNCCFWQGHLCRYVMPQPVCSICLCIGTTNTAQTLSAMGWSSPLMSSLVTVVKQGRCFLAAPICRFCHDTCTHVLLLCVLTFPIMGGCRHFHIRS